MIARNALMHKDLLNRLSLPKILTLLCCVSIVMSTMSAVLPSAVALSQVQINLNTNSNSYNGMQTADLYANLTFNNTPIHNGIMAVEVDKQSGDSPRAFKVTWMFLHYAASSMVT